MDYAFTDGTADASDYTAVNGTLSFADGEITKDIVVPLLPDALLEPDETFDVTLSNEIGVALGAITSTEVTIVNDDVAGELQFTSSTFSADEGSDIVITVARLGGSSGDISVNYTFTDVSADASDYTAVNGTLNIADGVKSGTFIVPLLDDEFFEGDETFIVTLSNAQGGATLGAITEAQVTIVDTTLSSSSSSSGCSCTYNPDGSVDPLLPALVFASLIYLGLRSRKSDV